MKKPEPHWISKAAALAIHEALIAHHGGVLGIRDEGLLESALSNPRNLLAYDNADIFRLAAAYAHAITRNRPLNDGNKRVTLTLAGVFLERNGFRLEAPETDAVSAMLALSTRKLDEVGFAAWLRGSSGKVRRPGRRGGSVKRANRGRISR